MRTEDNRIVVLIDMDCFYVQVEERENPQNKGKPACVVQYKNWKGGGIIAVNYEARANGVSRQMRGDEAKEKCPDCILYRVPEQRGKADLTKYRDAGKEVLDVLCSFGVCIERASIDEAYLDVTSVVDDIMKKSTDTCVTTDMLSNTHVVGFQEKDESSKGVEPWLNSLSEGEFNEKNWKLTHAAALCEKMRAAVYEKTGFRCSAGISANKMLAKLACGINKPNKQTILPPESVEEFFKTFPLKKVRHLGGKLGLILREEMNCTTMSDISNLSESALQQRFDTKTGTWLYWYARGVDLESVSSRRLPKSIGCNKNFTGIAALDTREKILHWLEELCAEVSERLEKDKLTNQRSAKLLTVTVRLDGDPRPASYSRSIPLTTNYDHKVMAKACLAIMTKENKSKKPNTWEPVVTCIGVSASKFVEAVEGKIQRFFSSAKNSGNSSASTSNLADLIAENAIEDTEIDSTINEMITDKLQESSSADDLSSDETELIPCEVKNNSSAPHSDIKEKKTKEREAEKEIFAPCLSESKPVPVKKLGFFASKNIQRAPTIVLTSDTDTKTVEDKPKENGIVEIEVNPLIKEIFPNLDEIDVETVGLLPLELQRDVFRIISSKKGTTQDATSKRFIACSVCHKQILEEEKEEHKDYHLALELQQQKEPIPTVSQTVRSKSTNTKKADKRPLEKQKGKPAAAKRSRTIESFFKSSS